MLLPIATLSAGLAPTNEFVPAAPIQAKTPDALDVTEGAVVFANITVNAKGIVEKVSVSHVNEKDFAISVKQTVKQWRFKPASLDGVAIPSQVIVPFKVVNTPPFFVRIENGQNGFVL